MAIPHIRTKEIAPVGQSPSGGIWSSNQACTGVIWNKTAPQVVVTTGGNRNTIQSEVRDYWDGDFISIPGRYSGKLLGRASDGRNRYLANHWKVDCVTVSGVQGFRVTSSDGTQYEFAKLRRVKGKLIQLSPDQPNFFYNRFDNIGDSGTIDLPGDSLTRDFQIYHTFMLPTKVTDRFGNTVTYTYNSSNRVTKIAASDGRQITFAYNSNGTIRSASAHGRTVYYDYDPTINIQFFGSLNWLSDVRLPSGKRWEFDRPSYSIGSVTQRVWEDYVTNTHIASTAAQSPEICVAGTQGKALTITHPDGLQGDFYFKETDQRRVNVPRRVLSQTADRGGNVTVHAYQLKPCNAIYSIDEKRLVDADDTTYTWQYDYIGANGSFEGKTAPTHSSHSTLTSYLPSGVHPRDLKTTQVRHPDNSVVRHHITTKFGPYEGKEVLTEYFDKNGPLLKRVSQSYVESSRSNGKSWMQFDESSDRQTLPRLTKIYQNSETYNTENFYDSNDLKIKVKENNTLGKTRYTKYEYHAESSIKVFGLPKRTLVSASDSNYKEVSQTRYHTLASGYKALPKEQLSFGKVVKKYEAYHTGTGVKGLPRKISYNRNYSEVYFDNYKRGKVTQVRQRDTVGTNFVAAKQWVDDFGNVTQIEDFRKLVTRFQYDAANRLKLVDPGNSKWLNTSISYTTISSSDGYTYVEPGWLKTTVSKGNYRLDTYYDNFLRPRFTAEWDTNNKAGTARYQRFKYDYNNKTTYASQAMSSHTTSRGVLSTYDGLGRLTKADDNTTSGSITYTYLGDNKVRVNNNRGYNTTTQYLAYGAPTQDVAVRIEAPHSVLTTLGYNIFGNVTSISQGGLTERRVYDSAQRLCKTIRADIGNMAYAYNTSGQTTWMAHGDSVDSSSSACDYSVSSSDKTTYAYDHHGNVKSATYGDSSPTKLFTYDNNDNLIKAIAGDVEQQYGYNDLNLIERETFEVDGLDWEVHYGYDSKGNLATTKYPSGGTLVYSPNGLGQPTRVGGFASSVTYHPNGQYKSFRHENSCTNTLTQHAYGLPNAQRTTCGSTNVVYNVYSWDANGNLTQWDDRQSNTFDLRMTYDQLDRVDNYRNFSNNLIGDMNYDTMGNITKFDSVVGGAMNYSYHSSNKRLLSVSGHKNYSFSYDERGNVTDNGRDTLTHNLANQVTRISGNSYVYDAHNRRVKTVDGTGTRYSMYTLSGTLIQERINGAGREYYYLGSQLVAQQGAGEKKYIHPDVMGSTAAKTNASRSVERTRYAPFGLAWGHSTKNEMGYTGHKQDSDTGLTYMQARYYDPVIGRFYSNDPIGFRDVHSFNRYTYANNNPYKFTDPTGMISCEQRTSCETINYGGGGGQNENTQDEERTWGSYLPGTEAGDYAAKYWAERVVNSEWYEDPTARAGLLFSVLWTDETAASTAFTLGTAGTGAISSRAIDFLTKGYGFKIGRAEFWYKLPKLNGRTYFAFKFKDGTSLRFQRGNWGKQNQPWYKLEYFKLPGKTNKHWPWQR